MIERIVRLPCPVRLPDGTICGSPSRYSLSRRKWICERGHEWVGESRWQIIRRRTLINEGFTPTEAAFLSVFRISSRALRRVRRARKRKVASYINQGYSFRESIMRTRNDIVQRDKEILTWSEFRRQVYPGS